MSYIQSITISNGDLLQLTKQCINDFTKYMIYTRDKSIHIKKHYPCCIHIDKMDSDSVELLLKEIKNKNSNVSCKFYDTVLSYNDITCSSITLKSITYTLDYSFYKKLIEITTTNY